VTDAHPPQPPAPPPDAEDEALLSAIAAGDRQAFTALFRRYAGRIKGFLMRGGFPAPEADEAAQEVMLSVWRRAGSFDPDKAAAATWIFAIARNRRVDMLRRRRPEPDPEDPLFAPEPERTPAQTAARRDRDRAVRAALAALSPEQLEMVRLAFFDGATHAEIAAAAGAPLGTVKSRLRLAMGKLRAALGPDFAEELFDD
jgi:RNA polymerase sigma-70 factor (ECF subfamily)